MRTLTLTLFLVALSVASFSQARRMVAVGSSTTEGQKATVYDSSWVARFNYLYRTQLGVSDSTCNLGVGGYTVYKGMPSSYSKLGRPTPDPAKNVTKAVAALEGYGTNGVVIVNFPTNGYEMYTIQEIMTCLHVIYDSATRTGNRCYITTTQPRTSGTFGTHAIKRKLADIKDAILAQFGEAHTLNFWDGMYNPADTSILAIYSAGDNTHFNNAGHRELFKRVVAKNVFNLPTPSVNDYRSNVAPSGNWESAASWVKWNGTTWARPANAPGSDAVSITVLGDDIINTTSNQSTNANLIISNKSTLNIGTNSLEVKGDWLNSGGTFSGGTGVVIFSGASDQKVSGTSQFGNVTVSKTGLLKLNGSTKINGILNLVSGVINVSAQYPLLLGTNATFTGGTSSSYIKGPVKKSISAGASFTFPAGDVANGKYRPVTLFNTGLTDNWTVEYSGINPKLSAYSPSARNADNVGSISAFEFWNITPDNTSNSASITLSYNTGSYVPPNVGNADHLLVVHWDAVNGRWDKPTGGGAVSHTGDNISGTVTVLNATSFSPYTLGSLDENSPLPVIWSGFSGRRLQNLITLSWSTAQEKNTSHFDVERSIDGRTFGKIGTTQAQGFSTLAKYYHFDDREVSASTTYYYRIRQVDLDDKFEYSTVVVMSGSEKAQARWSVWPNPINASQSFHVVSLDKVSDSVEAVEVRITASNGAVIFTERGYLNDIAIKVETLVQNLTNGLYGIHLSNGSHTEHFKVARY